MTNDQNGDKISYQAEDVVDGFAGAVTFSPEAAASTAAAITEAGPYGDLDPDEAGRKVQQAVYEATADEQNRGGQRVSIDTSLAALTAMHGRKARAGFQVGRGDQPGADRATGASGAADAGVGGGQGTAASAAAGSFPQRMKAAKAAKASKASKAAKAKSTGDGK